MEGEKAKWIVIFVIVFFVALAAYNYLATQQPPTTINLNPSISGSATLYYFSLSGLCSLPGIPLLFPQFVSGCPYLRLSETTNQQIPLTIAINRSILLAGHSVKIGSELGNSSQSATLILTLSAFGNTATDSYDISNINVPGSTTVQESGLPIKQLIADVSAEVFDILVDFNYLLFQVSFNSTTTLSTSMTQYAWFSGGSKSTMFKWTTGGFEQNATLQFNGGSNTINVTSLLNYNQSWNSSFGACTTALFIQTTCASLFKSITNTSLQNSTSAYRFYEININLSSGGTITNNKTAWYLSGYKLQLNASPNDGYAFAGYHYSNGTLISNDTKHTLVVMAPMNISANFVPKPSTDWWAYIIVFVILGGLLAIFFYIFYLGWRDINKPTKQGD